MFNIKGSRKTFWLSIFVVAGTLLVSAGHIATPDGHLRLAQATELVDHLTFALPNNIGDKGHGNIAESPTGQRFSVYNPGHILLLTLPVQVLTFLPDFEGIHEHYVAAFFSSFLGPLAHFLCAIALVSTRGLLGFTPRAALLGGLAYALGTVALPHAQDGYEQAFVALSLIFAFRFAIISSGSNDRHARQQALILCAISVGIGVLFRNTALLAVPGLLILLWDRRSWIVFGTVLTPFLGLIAVYNALRFGSPIETGYWQAWQFNAPVGMGYFSNPIPDGLFGLWLSPGKGLLIFSPVLILAVTALPRLYQQHRRVAIAVSITAVAYSVLYASNFAWHGSAWSWGPRYLIPIVPLLMLAFPSTIRFTPVPSISAAVLTLSIAIQIFAISADYRQHLVRVYMTEPSAFEDGRIFFDTRLSPIVGQVRSFSNILLQDARDRSVHFYRPDGRWTSHAKTVPLSTDYYNGIDYNTPNFWWARLAYLYPDAPLSFLSRFIGMASLAFFLLSVSMLCRITR